MVWPAWLVAPLLVPSIVAVGAGFAGTWAVRTFARRFGVVNKPNPIIPQHTRPVAYLGGVGIAIGVAAGVLALHVSEGPLVRAAVAPMAVWVPAVLFLAVGVADDLMAFKPAPKFALQGVVAVLAVLLGVIGPFTGVTALDAACNDKD